MEKKKLTAETLKYVTYLSAPAASRDGKKAAFVRTKADEKTGEFAAEVAEYADGEVKVLGEGSAPAYAPAGDALAYLSKKSGEAQIWLRENGAKRQLTHARHGVKRFSWSPDGQRLLFETQVWPDELKSECFFTEFTPGEKEDWLYEQEMAPQVIEEIAYKYDDFFGVEPPCHTCIGEVDLAGRERLLTREGRRYFPVYAPDGQTAAWYGRPYHDTRAFSHEIYVYENGEERALTEKAELMADAPLIFTPDGTALITEGFYMAEGGFEQRLYRRKLSDGAAEPLFLGGEDGTCRSVNNMAIGRTLYGAQSPYFQIDAAGEWVYFRSGWQGRESVYRVKADGSGAVETVLRGEFNVQSFTVPADGRMFALIGDEKTIAELYLVDLKAEGAPARRRLTESNAWQRDYVFNPAQEFWFTSRDGKARIQTWVVLPPDLREGETCAAVLDIHGGPECMYVSDYWHEFQAFAAAGLAVICCNPRGSLGYGLKFSSGEVSWGEEAVSDLCAAVDEAAARFPIDPTRVGVTGGSYGGYMTVKLIGTTKRFRAAAAQRCLCNMATSYGTGDMGFESARTEDLSTIRMKKVLTDRARKSLIKNVDAIDIPVLILHGYKDYRCGFEQAEQLFIPLKERHPDLPVRMVVFPKENHGVTRTGNLYSQIAHLDEMVQWMKKYL